MMFNDSNWVTEICEEAGTSFAFKVRRKLHSERSPYQLIEVYETECWGNVLLIDGFTMLSSRDNFIYHEMMAHPVLFTHLRPRRVAIIGGGDCGTLREVLRHGEVDSVTQIDIDERVTRVAERFFPELCESNGDPRAQLRFEDGIAWIKRVEPGSLDVVIVDSTDPIGPGEVLFTSEFYAACRQALARDGLFVQQSESPLIHESLLRDMGERLHEAGFRAQRTLFFPLPVYPSGWWSATMAGDFAALDGFRRQDVDPARLGTRYYNADIHLSASALPEFLRRRQLPGARR